MGNGLTPGSRELKRQKKCRPKNYRAYPNQFKDLSEFKEKEKEEETKKYEN